jgi:hypothetical protein
MVEHTEQPESSSVRSRNAQLGWVLIAAVLAVVIGLIAIGAVRIVSADDREPASPRPEAQSSLPSPAPIPPARKHKPPQITGAVFVDVRTGRVTPLPDSIRSLEDVRHVQASPDGTQLAFETATGIFVAGADGTHIRRLALGSAPSWSPDGTEVVFATAFSGFVADVKTGSTSEVLHGKKPIYHLNFSGDGRTILFTRKQAGVLHLWSVPARGGSVHLVLEHAAFGSYSPDGTMIAFRRTSYDGRDITEMTEGSVWLANADGSRRHPLGKGFVWMSQVDAMRLWPMWSPDGDSVVFERTVAGDLRVVDVRTGHVTKLGTGKHPSWLDGHTLIVENYVVPDHRGCPHQNQLIDKVRHRADEPFRVADVHRMAETRRPDPSSVLQQRLRVREALVPHAAEIGVSDQHDDRALDPPEDVVVVSRVHLVELDHGVEHRGVIPAGGLGRPSQLVLVPTDRVLEADDVPGFEPDRRVAHSSHQLVEGQRGARVRPHRLEHRTTLSDLALQDPRVVDRREGHVLVDDRAHSRRVQRRPDHGDLPAERVAEQDRRLPDDVLEEGGDVVGVVEEAVVPGRPRREPVAAQIGCERVRLRGDWLDHPPPPLPS